MVTEEKELKTGGKKKVLGGTGVKRKKQEPIEQSAKRKGSTTVKKKVEGGTGAKKKVRGGTGRKKKKSLLDKTLMLGDTELSFSLKRTVKPKNNKGNVHSEPFFPSYITVLFLTIILTAMGYAIYLDLQKGLSTTL